MGDSLVELVSEFLGGLVPDEPARKLTGVLMLVCCLAFVGFAGFLAYRNCSRPGIFWPETDGRTDPIVI